MYVYLCADEIFKLGGLNFSDDQGYGYMDGDLNSMPNGDDSEPPVVSSCDIIRITGKPENCEAAKQALIDNVPITIEVFMLCYF